MSWWLVILLAATAYGFKVAGLVLIGVRPLPAAVERCVALIPAALLTALIVKDTFSTGQTLVLDARAAGVGAAVLACWAKAPIVVAIVVGAVVTALVRAI